MILLLQAGESLCAYPNPEVPQREQNQCRCNREYFLVHNFSLEFKLILGAGSPAPSGLSRTDRRSVCSLTGVFECPELKPRKLRIAFGDAADNPRFIETLPRRGYRFVAPVHDAVSVPPQLSESVDVRDVAAEPPPARSRSRKIVGRGIGGCGSACCSGERHISKSLSFAHKLHRPETSDAGRAAISEYEQ